MKWYAIQRNWNKSDLVNHSLTTEINEAQCFLKQYQHKVAMQNAIKLGIEKNVDIDFYINSVSAQIVTLSKADLAQLSVERMMLLKRD